MLAFDFLRVKNTGYGGNAESLEWALAVNAELTSCGMKNSLAQSITHNALKKRIEGRLSSGISAEDFAREELKKKAPQSYEGERNLWHDLAVLFLVYAGICYMMLGVTTLVNQQEAHTVLLLLPLLISVLAVLCQQSWYFLLGYLKPQLASVVGFALLALAILLLPLTFSDNNPYTLEGRSIGAWAFFLAGALCMFLTVLIYRGIDKDLLRPQKRNFTDARWERTARSYARRKLIINEAYLDTHIQAAKDAAVQQNRPLIQMCGNPVSYLKTAPQDPGYKPWMQMLGYSSLALILILAGITLHFTQGFGIAFFLLLAIIQIWGATISYRDYKRKTSR